MGTKNRTRSRSRSRGAPARHAGLGALFWICMAVIVGAVGFAAREPIANAFQRLSGHPAPPAAPAPQVTVRPLSGSETTPPAATSRPEASRSTTPTTTSVRPGGSTPSTASTSSPTASLPAGAAAPQAGVPSEPRVRKARLFFAAVDENGAITVKSVIRSVPASDSPLKDSLSALLRGPTSQELNLGLVSMIPTAAALRGVVVKDDTAVVDFSEGFRFNAQGIDAMTAQLRQVVYAATEFPTVKQVQLLIEGKKVTYLGTEGVRIDEPLSRASFQK